MSAAAQSRDEFLAARIAEDIDFANVAGDYRGERLRAEAAAKQAIVLHSDNLLGGPEWRDALEYVKSELVWIYRGHPDWRAEWVL